MIINKQIINSLLVMTAVLAITACGGGSGGSSSSSCISNVIDSDGDGFSDTVDKAPNDPSIPGDLSSPEKILADPEVKRSLKEAKERGVNVRTELGNNPPKLTGYYRMEYGGGRSIEEHSTIVRDYVGIEDRICTTSSRYEESGTNFTPATGGGRAPFHIKNAILRGDNNNFTYYFLGSSSCGNDTTEYLVLINSGRLNSDGDIVDKNNIQVTYKIIGPNMSQCRYKGWSAVNHADSNKINDIDTLEYMCVDDKKAYVTGETWTNKDKESCKCTANIETVCN